MRIRHSILTPLLLSAFALPASAAVFVQTDINLGPGEPYQEYVPAPRPGYVWSPGYWQWDGYNRYWTQGYWIQERPGYVWVPDRWDHYDNGWRFANGHYYTGRNYHPPHSVAVNHYNDHDDRRGYGAVAVHTSPSGVRHDEPHRNGPDIRGPGVSGFNTNNGRSNGHGPHDH